MLPVLYTLESKVVFFYKVALHSVFRPSGEQVIQLLHFAFASFSLVRNLGCFLGLEENVGLI